MAAKKRELKDFLIPGLKSLGTGLRFGSEIAAGLEARTAGAFNAKQASAELKDLGVSKLMSTKQMERYASAFKGQQQTAVATSGLAISGSIVDMMADTAAQLKLQQSMQERDFDIQRQNIEQQKALAKRQAKAGEYGAYFRAATQLGSGISDLLK